MSTLKTANIQDTSGNNNSTPEQISQGRAKAWVIFNGSTFGELDSFNVTSVVDGGTGSYNVYTNTVSSNSVVVTSGAIVYTSIGGNNTRQTQIKQVSDTRFDITTWNATGVLTDHDRVNVVVFGD